MSDVPNNNNNEDSTQESSNEVVSKKAYSEVSKDMLKYKQEMKALQAQLAQVQADKEAADTAQLQEKEEWHQLYKIAETKLSTLAQERDAERNKFITFHKVNAVVEKLGGFKKPEYTKFIDTNAIEIDENGSVIEDTVLSQVERIRKEYPELIKQSQKQELPNAAPRAGAERSYSQLTEKEKIELKLSLAKQNKK